MDFLNRFKELIKEKNTSITEIAKCTSIPRSTLSSYVNRKSIPSAIQLDQLATYFSCSIDYLVGRTNDFELVDNSFISYPLTKEEQLLISNFNVLNTYERESIMIQISALANKHQTKQ